MQNAESAKVIIIGGGIIGLSVAYHLGKFGWDDVLVLERHQLTSGTSWHAAGIVGPLRANLNLTKLAMYATQLFASLESETGQATGYKQTGGMWLAQTPDRMIELRRIAAMGDVNGLNVRVLSAAEAKDSMPLMQVDDVVGALWVDEDGQTNPVDTCLAYAKGAKAAGVRIRENTRVSDINTANGAVHSVVTDDHVTIRCDYIVNCAGAWARQIGMLAGVAVPLQAVEHMYIVTEPIAELPQPCPILRDLEGRIYIKEDAGKLVLGGFEPNAKLWWAPEDGSEGSYLMFPEDWEQFEPFMKAGLNRLPILEKTGIRHFMNGPESFTPDTSQLMGESPELRNFFVAAGFNSIGIMSSAGVGRVMAEWIADGEPPMDLWTVDIARADPMWNTSSFLAARTPEAVANQLAMHWPYKQMETARDLRRSPLHDAFAQAGAVFGAPTGWERPLWFAADYNDKEIRYSYDAQPWWGCAEREVKAVQNGVALLELSPFTKIRLTGANAESSLQRLCTSNVALDPGRLVYTLMLNKRGGIEADMTVRRVAENEFWMISGAATRWKDQAWIRRLTADDDIQICDITEDYAVLGVMGPQSRALLQSWSELDMSSERFPFSSAREIKINSAQVTVQRVSFVGELGYELYIPAAVARHCYESIVAVGEAYGLSHAGHYCLDACRIEKGFKHWGHDISSEDSPIEAGLSFTVDYHKHADFHGRDALLRQRDKGVDRHLLLFSVDGAHPLLLQDEPIYRVNEFAGLTTSGARGFRTNLSLCFGYVKTNSGETRQDLFGSTYEVSVAGERFPLTALRQPPYDPNALRMRG
ncbi:MAG: FAD-dependent oxidoreductase [Gammaproteobacteria bacterium]|nr:FAD-dependent oxidoreductase [Gammaproteobacteria bacterium]